MDKDFRIFHNLHPEIVTDMNANGWMQRFGQLLLSSQNITKGNTYLGFWRFKRTSNDHIITLGNSAQVESKLLCFPNQEGDFVRVQDASLPPPLDYVQLQKTLTGETEVFGSLNTIIEQGMIPLLGSQLRLLKGDRIMGRYYAAPEPQVIYLRLIANLK